MSDVVKLGSFWGPYGCFMGLQRAKEARSEGNLLQQPPPP